MWPVDLLGTSLWPQAELAFDRSMADLLCHRSFFNYRDNTLNMWINNNGNNYNSAATKSEKHYFRCLPPESAWVWRKELTRDGTACTGIEKICFPIELITSRIDNDTRLIHTLMQILTTHTTERWKNNRTHQPQIRVYLLAQYPDIIACTSKDKCTYWFL